MKFRQRMASFFYLEIFLLFIGCVPFCLPMQKEVLLQNVAMKKGFRLTNEYVLKAVSTTSVIDCAFQCLNEECCASITYHVSSEVHQKNCQLNIPSLNYSGPLLRDEHANYYELVDLYKALNRCCFIKCQNEGHCDETTGKCLCMAGFSGSFCEISIGSVNYLHGAARSCFEIKTLNNQSSSGVYLIQLNTSDEENANTTLPLEVYCDMDTYGGGWTLVYSYTFTNYDNFFHVGNAITPRPTWTSAAADVEISTDAPLNETAFGALDYELWQNIGEEFLIKSNINDWIICQPDGGSLVRGVNGYLSCINIKNVATACEGVEPYRITWENACGPRIYASTSFYRFDGSKENCYPSHDPCNSGATENHKRNVLNPGGKIFIK